MWIIRLKYIILIHDLNEHNVGEKTITLFVYFHKYEAEHSILH